MFKYLHFAHPRLYLNNGYTVHKRGRSVSHSYEQEDKLEQCVRRILIRRAGPLYGKDLRFLRRGMQMSQVELGSHIGKDAQTVARLEKSKKAIPQLFDLGIRALFARMFDAELSIATLVDAVRGVTKADQKFYVLNFTGDDWEFESSVRIPYEVGKASDVLPTCIFRGTKTTSLPRLDPVETYVSLVGAGGTASVLVRLIAAANFGEATILPSHERFFGHLVGDAQKIGGPSGVAAFPGEHYGVAGYLGFKPQSPH